MGFSKARVYLFIFFCILYICSVKSELQEQSNILFSLAASCNLFITSKLYTATKQLTVVSHKWKRYYLLSLFG